MTRSGSVSLASFMHDDPRHHAIRGEAISLAEPHPAEIRLRPLASLEDYRDCVALQSQVWGPAYGELVPASLLQIVTHVGGVAVGAFSADGQLLGFVFGLTGVKDCEVVHWSHVLGVREPAQNAGIGRMLKEHQRAELAHRGIAKTYWTFDPLIAKNAHLNLNRLGARVVEYVPNMYGMTGSPLHHGLATDRLVVVCATTADRVQRTPMAAVPLASPGSIPILTLGPRSGDLLLAGESEPPPVVWIEVPIDIEQVIARAPATAAAWHAALRTHFEWALGHGYTVTGLHRDPVASRSFYTLALDPAAP